jgi:NAD(P)-dependent dehydrogenase (short-subunit alcohol dehydrogenase family)
MVLSSFSLSTKKAVVTGASQGLGEAMAYALAEAGADIAVVDKNIAGATKVADKIRGMNRNAIAIEADVSHANDVSQIVKKVKENFGTIDILVNNAGTNEWTPAEDMSEEVWDHVVDIDLKGVFLCSQAVGREMIKNRKGSIINISSICGSVVNKIDKKGDVVPQVHYHASKGGVIMLTRALAAEWVKYNIRVNCISPGFFLSPFVEELFRDNKELFEVEILQRTPMKRAGDPKELGPLAVFLASDASSFVTGQNIVVDGGYTIW